MTIHYYNPKIFYIFKKTDSVLKTNIAAGSRNHCYKRKRNNAFCVLLVYMSLWSIQQQQQQQ